MNCPNPIGHFTFIPCQIALPKQTLHAAERSAFIYRNAFIFQLCNNFQIIPWKQRDQRNIICCSIYIVDKIQYYTTWTILYNIIDDISYPMPLYTTAPRHILPSYSFERSPSFSGYLIISDDHSRLIHNHCTIIRDVIHYDCVCSNSHIVTDMDISDNFSTCTN